MVPHILQGVDAGGIGRGKSLRRIGRGVVDIAVEPGMLGSPFWHKCAHSAHVSTTLSAAFHERTPYGQAIMQYLQPMHFSLSTSTMPSASR